MKQKKLVFEGWTCKAFSPCWTVWKWFNLAAVVEKSKVAATKRYKNVSKVRITIEVIG